MDQVEKGFGRPNPNAPAALSRFAFLIGKWRCEARVRLADGAWQNLQGAWIGRFILDGYAIADEYRMTGSSGGLIVLGLNLRTDDATKGTWNMKWLNALAGTWVDLGSEELGGVSFDGQSIFYALKEPVAAHAYTRATYTNISEQPACPGGDGRECSAGGGRAVPVWRSGVLTGRAPAISSPSFRPFEQDDPFRREPIQTVVVVPQRFGILAIA
jgi:hypothetical protein